MNTFLEKTKAIRDGYKVVPSNRGGNVADYLDYSLRIFNEECVVMQEHKIARAHMTAYSMRQKTIHKFIERLVDNKRTLISVGDVTFAANSPMKGHRRFPWALFLATLRRHRLVDVVMTNEFRTSILCSKCYRLMSKSEKSKDR